MNWKNIKIDSGMVSQEIAIKGTNTVNYIPLDKVDSFGVTNTENKRLLYAGFFFTVCTMLLLVPDDPQTSAILIFGVLAFSFFCLYFFTRQTCLTITSNQTRFSVQVRNTSEEVREVNAFVKEMKNQITSQENYQPKAS